MLKSFIKNIIVSIINLSFSLFKKVRLIHQSTVPFVLNCINENKYNNIDFNEVKRSKKSDVVFICGTGPSVSDISDQMWREIEKHDVLSFRDFPKQKNVKVDFHVTGEVDDIRQYARTINENPLYEDTLFLVQDGFMAQRGNALIGRLLLKRNAKGVFRYKRTSRGEFASLSKSINDGIVHGFNSVTGMINIAYLMGWKKIVLVGVDLHGHQYFYHDPNVVRDVEKSGITVDSPYTNSDKTVELIRIWNNDLKVDGVSLFTYSPKSKLAEVIPTFTWNEIEKTH